MGVGSSSTVLIMMMVSLDGHAAAVAAFGCATCGGISQGIGGRNFGTDTYSVMIAAQLHHQQNRIIFSSRRSLLTLRILAAASSGDSYDDGITIDDEDDDVVLDESWSKRYTAARFASPSAETSQLNDSATVVTGMASGEGRYPIIESWLQSYIPTLSPSDSQTYASILANDGFTSLERLDTINSKASGRVEDLYFMKKEHRRRLMVELGVTRSRRSRAVGTATTDRRAARPTAADVQRTNAWLASKESLRERPPLDETISNWLAEQSRLVEERAREHAAATDDSTATTTTTDRDDAHFVETTEQSATEGLVDDAASMQQTWQRVSSSLSEEGYSILDDLSARFPSLDDRMMGEGSARDELRRLRELKAAYQRSKSSSVSTATDDDIILDDLTSRYSSLEIKPLDDGCAEKENRRLRELRETFQKKKVDKVESNDSYYEDYASMSDDFVTRYDALDTTVALDKVGTANKEARRLEELKKAFLSRRNKFSSDAGIVGEDDVLRLDLMKRPTMEEAAIEQKERMRMKEIQRLARLAAEKKVDTGSHSSARQQPRGRREVMEERGSIIGSNAENHERNTILTKRYKTNEERRLEALQKNRTKSRLNNAGRSTPPKATMRSRQPPTTTPPSNRSIQAAREEAILSEMKTILAEIDKHTYRDSTKSYTEIRTPQNRVTARRRSIENGSTIGVGGQALECEIDDEECWDITRSPNFYSRESQSLATTLPPINMRTKATHEADEYVTSTKAEQVKQEFEQSSLTASPLQATSMQLDGGGKLECSPIDSSDKTSVSSNAPSSETTSSKNELESLADFTQEGDINVSSSSQISSTQQKVAEDPSHVKVETDEQEHTTEAPSTKSPLPTQFRPSLFSDNDVLLDVSSHFPVKTRQTERNRFNVSSKEEADTSHAVTSVGSTNGHGHLSKACLNKSQFRTHLRPSSFSDNDIILDVSSHFPDIRPFTTVQTKRKEQDRFNASQGMARGRQFLDKPRPFHPNLDMVTSNTSGSSFKRTSDFHPEEKNMQREFFDVCTRPLPGKDDMAFTKVSRILEVASASRVGLGQGVVDITRTPMSTLERSSSTIRDASNVQLGNPHEGNTNPTSTNIDASIQPGEEQVMQWLLTHLPNLEEEEAITYFNVLVNDGFDCNESLGEILAEDLHFMSIEHQVAVLRSFQQSNEVPE